jgi:hypothetical protein
MARWIFISSLDGWIGLADVGVELCGRGGNDALYKITTDVMHQKSPENP